MESFLCWIERLVNGKDDYQSDECELKVRARRGLFYVPELDGYSQYERYNMCAPKMKVSHLVLFLFI